MTFVHNLLLIAMLLLRAHLYCCPMNEALQISLYCRVETKKTSALAEAEKSSDNFLDPVER